MVEMYICLLKALDYITLVCQNSLHRCLHHIHEHFMLCFNTFSLIKANRILLPHIHTKNVSLNCWRIEKPFFINLSTIWDNIYRWANQYRCETALCLFSMLSRAYNIIIDCGISVLEHGREVIEGINVTEKVFFSI